LKVIDLDAERSDLFNIITDSETATVRSEAAAMRSVAPLPARDQIRVLIVVALPKELAAVQAAMARYEQIGVINDPNVYAMGEFADPDGRLPPRAVLVCQSGMGNNNAATTATDALRSFPGIDHLIMCGIAGGCPNPNSPDEHVRLGDIVFSNEFGIIEYDFVKEGGEGTTIRSSPQKPSNRMLAVIGALLADEILGRRPWEVGIEGITAASAAFARPDDRTDVLHDAQGKVLDHPDGSERHGRPKVLGGAIATADTLQKNPGTRDDLRDKYRARAIEMEAGGMQNAAWARDKSIMVVRGICDYCDPQKNDVWQMYAAAVAAAFTRTLVLSLPREWFPTVE
jgi:nucleoside phosphorylase